MNEVQINRNGLHLDIEDPQPLEDLRISKVEAVKRDFGPELVKTSQSLLYDDENPDFRLPNVGMLPVLEKLPLEKGKRLTGDLSSPCRRLQRQDPQFFDSAVASFVEHHELGIIRRNKGVSRASIVADAARAFSGYSIIVLVHSKHEVETIARGIRAALPRHSPIHIGTAYKNHPFHYHEDEIFSGVIVSTFRVAADLDFAQSDIVFMANADQCVHEAARYLMEVPDARFRLFGIDKQNGRRTPYVENVKARVFGFDVLHVGRYGTTRRDIRVTWVDTPKIRLKHDHNLQDLCCHAKRNDEIVEIAKLVASKDIGNRNPVTAVLVEDITQFKYISAELDDWELFVDESMESSLNGSLRARLRRQRRTWCLGQKTVVLQDGNYQGFNGKSLDCLIWVGATRKSPQLPANWLFDDQTSKKPLFIVDFKDRSSQAVRWRRDRARDYTNNNIFRPGVSSRDGGIEKFIQKLQYGGNR